VSHYQHLIYDPRGSVTVITINRAERMNAIGPVVSVALTRTPRPAPDWVIDQLWAFVAGAVRLTETARCTS
jgi:hypothetical protein